MKSARPSSDKLNQHPRARSSTLPSGTGELTLQEAVLIYVNRRAICTKTRNQYLGIAQNAFGDWMQLAIACITGDMVEERHRALCMRETRKGTSGHGQASAAFELLWCILQYEIETGTGKGSLKFNPVNRLSLNRALYRNPSRKEIISDQTLHAWYVAVANSADFDVSRDYLLFLLLTGMRLTEARRIEWSMIDLKEKTLRVPAAITQAKRSYLIPLSTHVFELLQRRYSKRIYSDWVFQSGRNRAKPICGEFYRIVKNIREQSGVEFQLEDLRRTFLAKGQALGIHQLTLYALADMRLKDMTARYVIPDIERLRIATEAISEALAQSMILNVADLSAPKRIQAGKMPAGTQLFLDFSAR